MDIVPPCGGRNHVFGSAGAAADRRYRWPPDGRAPPRLRTRRRARRRCRCSRSPSPAAADDDSPVEVQLKEETAEADRARLPGAGDQEHDPGRRRGPGRRRRRRSRAPSIRASTRGRGRSAVTLVDSDDWRAGIAAAVLMAPPLRAPILLTDGDGRARARPSTALDSLRPTGARAAARGAGGRDRRGARARTTLRAPPDRRQATRSSWPRRSTRSRPTSAGARRRTS